MLGKVDPQISFFALPFWADGLVDPDSFYARMGALWSRVSSDEDLADMYDEGKGRQSIPPSLLCGVLILQYFDNVSDREAAERVRFDVRWKLALNLPLPYRGFHYSVLCVFRKRLLEHGKERYAFDRLVQLAIETGILQRDVEQVIDSTAIHGAAAVEDTYKLIRNAIRKLLRAMGETPAKRERLSKRLKLSEYAEKGKPKLDWSDPQARKEHLQEIVAAAGRLLSEAQATTIPVGSEAEGALALLQQVLAQDVGTDPEGLHEIKQGVAKDRVISTVDPEMRHGRKSASRRIDGYKVHLAGDPSTELLTEVLVTGANAYDGEAVEPLVDALAEHNGLKPKAIVGDQSVIDADRRRALLDRGIEPVGKVGVHRPAGRYAKSDFDIDLEQGKVTCPGGHITSQSKTSKDRKGRSCQTYHFPREVCDDCPRRPCCTKAQKTGRTVSIHPHEALLQAARKEQQTEAFRKRYNDARSTNERMVSQVVRHGMRQGRYFGQVKTEFQALWTCAAVNMHRLMTLICARDGTEALSAA
jgi:transposase